jgi:hypothetical protein
VCAVVGSIVRVAREAFEENDWRRKAKPLEKARSYAGLLCAEAGFFSLRDARQRALADVIRRRLARQPRPLDPSDAELLEHESARILKDRRFVVSSKPSPAAPTTP